MNIGQITHEYLAALRFVVADAERDPKFSTNHLLSYLAQDFIESAIAITFLASQGALRPAKRELRFIIESSVKICFIQQKSYSTLIADKVSQFDRVLSSPSISIKRDLAINLIPEGLQDPFSEEVGRLYGETSGYVHLTPRQIVERIASVDAGRTVGYESPQEVANLDGLISRGYAVSLALLLHSVPSYVAGDWLVDSDGSSNNSYFLGSRFIAGIDTSFDYKHERQHALSDIKTKRAKRITF